MPIISPATRRNPKTRLVFAGLFVLLSLGALMFVSGGLAVWAVLAALITPTGDPFTLLVVFLPLYGLYELSVLVVPGSRDGAGGSSQE